MKITNEQAKMLKNGEFIDFNNQEFCDNHQTDDVMGGHIQFNPKFNLFAIFFNGACIHTSKGIASINKKLDALEDKFSTIFEINEIEE
jgi:hypothetical protein